MTGVSFLCCAVRSAVRFLEAICQRHVLVHCRVAGPYNELETRACVTFSTAAGALTMRVRRGWCCAEVLHAQAVAEVLARGMHDPGALAQVCEQHRRARSLPVPVAVELGAHVPDREVIPHDLESYDAHRRRD